MDSLIKTNRICLLNKLMVDETTGEIDDFKYESILTNKFDEFIEVCEIVESDPNSVKDVKCYVEDGELKFSIIHK